MTSLFITEMHIKTRVKYYLTSTRIGRTKSQIKKTSIDKDVEKLKLRDSFGVPCKTVQLLWKTV